MLAINENLKEDPFPLNFCPGQVEAVNVKPEEIDEVCLNLINAANCLIILTEEDLQYIDPEQIFSRQYRQDFKIAMQANDFKKAMKIVLRQCIFMELQYIYLKKCKEKIQDEMKKNKFSISKILANFIRSEN